MCKCEGDFHSGSKSVEAHNVTDNAAKHMSYGLRGRRVTPAPLFSLPQPVWRNFTGSVHVLAARGGLMEGQVNDKRHKYLL